MRFLKVGRDGGAAPSFIGADLKVVGSLRSAGDIRVDGTVEGEIHGRELTVGEGGRIQGSIFAQVARISGSVNGRVEAISVSIAGTAKVKGDIFHHTLSIEKGAVLKGLRPWRPLPRRN